MPYGFRFLLALPDGEPNDPAVLVTAVPNWSAGGIITLGAGQQLRVVATDPEIADELIAEGFNGMLVVEPL